MENLIFKGTYTEDELNEFDLEMNCEFECNNEDDEVFVHEYPYNSYLTTKQFYNNNGKEVSYIYSKYWSDDIIVYDIYFKEKDDLEITQELKEEFEKIDEFLQENKKPSIIYKESILLKNENEFDILIDQKKEITKNKLFNNSGCLNIGEIETRQIQSSACEIKKVVIYSEYKDQIDTDEILYKRNLDNTISIFEKIEE